jgi:transmembrane sensor
VSETGNHESRLAQAKKIKFEAGAWVEQQDNRELDQAEQAEFDAWLSESLAHRVAYWRADAVWRSANRLGALRPSKVSSIELRERRMVPMLVRVAAAVAMIGVVIGASHLFLSGTAEKTYATPVGGHRTLVLDDGSIIELNTDTVLHTALNSSQRLVMLDHGEVYFQIKHDAARPFVVKVAGHKVTDLGTKFLIRADEGQLEVALMEGRARLDTADAWIQRHSAVLLPGDVIVATANSMSRNTRTTRQLDSDLGWQRGVIVFYRTPLAEAAEQFNRYNHEKIVIADASLNALPINGTLAANDPEQFTRVLRNLFDVRTEKRGDGIVISR